MPTISANELSGIRCWSAIGLAIVCFAAVTVPVPIPVVRLIAGAVLVLILPGRAVTELVLHDQPSTWPTTLLGTAAFSIVTTIVGGFILFVFSLATTAALAGYLATVTIACEAAGARVHSESSFGPVPRLNLTRFAQFFVPASLAIAAVVVAISIAFHAERADTGGNFTTFGVSPVSAPGNLYRITLSNHSTSKGRFIVDELTTARRTQLRSVLLAPQGSVAFDVVLRQRATRAVRLVLRRPGSRSAYRLLYLAPQSTEARRAPLGNRRAHPLNCGRTCPKKRGVE